MAEPARAQPSFDAPLIQRPPSQTPVPAAPPASAPSSAPRGRVFAADLPQAADALAEAPAIERLAELVAHRDAETPFVVGLIGGPGVGKSRALAALSAAAADLSAQAGAAKASPFLPGLVIAPVSAKAGAPFAARLHAALTQAAPALAADAAEEAAHAASDPHAQLRAVTESLDGARRRLDAERKARDDAENRRARLTETVLYESGGSRVDAYARANRTSIEAILTSFGFTSGDALSTYKSLVHSLADMSVPGRWLTSLKALWAYRGQMRLIVWALALLAIAWALGMMYQESWLSPLESGGETLKSVSGFIRAHAGTFDLAASACKLGALACLAWLVVRAIRFARPLLRGATLVDADVATRRGELDNLVAHHAQRVEALGAEADALGRRAAEAERRAASSGRAVATPSFLESGDAAAASRAAYVATLGERTARAGGRILVTLDGLDQAAPADALAALEEAAALTAAPGFALVAAIDAQRVIDALPDARMRLDRIVQIPYRVEPGETTAWADFVARVAAARAPAPARKRDASRSTLDLGLDDTEKRLLGGLAPLAGPSPRGVKRFVNLYRLGRHDASGDLAAFAFVLALAIGGLPEEFAAFDKAVSNADSKTPVRREGLTPRMVAALDAVQALQGHSVSVGEARRATALAARWTAGA